MDDTSGDNVTKDNTGDLDLDHVPHDVPDPEKEDFEAELAEADAQRKADKIELNIKQNSDVKKTLKEKSNDEYEIKLMSEAEDQPYDQKQGYKFSGDNLLFIKGLRDTEKHLKKYIGEIVIIDGTKIKIMSFNEAKNVCTLIIYGGIGLGDKKVVLNIYVNTKSDEKCMLVKRSRGSSIQHAHLAMETFKWLLDKYLEGEINEAKWKSFDPKNVTSQTWGPNRPP